MDILNNQYTVLALSVFVALYGSNARIQLPSNIQKLFQIDVFRVAFLAMLLVFRFDKAPHVAVIVSLVFLLTMYHLNKIETFKFIENFK